MPTPRQREIDRHERAKSKVASALKRDLTRILGNENIGEALIAALMAVLYAIVALLAAPEPAISKLTALLLTIGVSVFGAALIITVLLSSRGSITDAFGRRDDAEKAEDARHRRALEQMT